METPIRRCGRRAVSRIARTGHREGVTRSQPKEEANEQVDFAAAGYSAPARLVARSAASANFSERRVGELIRLSPSIAVWSIGRTHARPALFVSPHLHAPPPRCVAPRVRARRSHPRASGGRFMQHPASELRRILQRVEKLAGAMRISDDGCPGGGGCSPKRSVPEAAGPEHAPSSSVPCPRT